MGEYEQNRIIAEKIEGMGFEVKSWNLNMYLRDNIIKKTAATYTFTTYTFVTYSLISCCCNKIIEACENIFVYVRLALESHFTNREEEMLRLKNNFNSLINTAIISPRRWGKTSLVRLAAESSMKENKKLKVIHLDIFNIRSEYEFYLLLANEVLKATSSGWDELVRNTRMFLERLIPQISFSPDNQNRVSFSIGWEQLQKNPDEILNLAENIARKKT